MKYFWQLIGGLKVVLLIVIGAYAGYGFLAGAGKSQETLEKDMAKGLKWLKDHH